jgi:hypothetical protein
MKFRAAEAEKLHLDQQEPTKEMTEAVLHGRRRTVWPVQW